MKAGAVGVRWRRTAARSAVVAALIAVPALVAFRLTAKLGVPAVRSGLAAAVGPGNSALAVECRAVMPGLIHCSYYVRRSRPVSAKEGGRFYESYYLWYGFGYHRVRHMAGDVT
ncbi:MAG: hypothetical protein IRY99_28055 [Isosphaeraceae bacterium]|nr:hypothetical protein [Isosphaeraceae bacterium]